MAKPWANNITRVELFWSKVDTLTTPDECWPWLGYVQTDGYGVFVFRWYRTAAHRTAYALTYGPIRRDQVVHHTCRNRLCVRPSHLAALTHREHYQVSPEWVTHQTPRTHCSQGHELTPDNTYTRRDTGMRQCRICKRAALACLRAKAQAERTVTNGL